MGRNWKWVLEDNISEAVWRTILRGPRPQGAGWPAAKCTKASAAAKWSTTPASKKVKGKGQSLGDKASPFKAQAQPHPTQREQLKAAQARVVKLKSAIMAIGEEDPAAAGLQEALVRAQVQAQLRPVGPLHEEDGDF